MTTTIRTQESHSSADIRSRMRDTFLKFEDDVDREILRVFFVLPRFPFQSKSRKRFTFHVSSPDFLIVPTSMHGSSAAVRDSSSQREQETERCLATGTVSTSKSARRRQ
jgi:hypothetical protein